MAELRELIERFCLHPRRGLIVTVVTLGVMLVLGIPLVDDYMAIGEDRARLAEQLATSQETAKTLPQLEASAAKVIEERTTWEAKTIDESRVPELRSRLVEIARETGCQVRRINFESTQTRPWYADDNALAENVKAELQKGTTPFVLETRPVSLSVVGPTAAVSTLLERIEQDQKLLHARLIEVRPADGARKSVQLDLELWYFALGPVKSA